MKKTLWAIVSLMASTSLQAVPMEDIPWLGQVSPFALMELEIGYTDNADFVDGSASDLTVATVAFGSQLTFDPQFSGVVSFLYEEDETDLEIDEAFITYRPELYPPLTLTLGQTYVPFGAYNTALVNDTLILELAETRETTAIAQWQQGPVSVSAFLFNGDTDGDDTLENGGISVDWTGGHSGAGIGWINNILDSDGIGGTLADAAEVLATELVVNERVGALIAHGHLRVADFHLNGEYLAIDRISPRTTNVIASSIKPSALQLEISTEVGQHIGVVAWQQTDDAALLGLPESRLSAGYRYVISAHATAAAEIWHDEDYSRREGGTGDQANSLVLQLAFAY